MIIVDINMSIKCSMFRLPLVISVNITLKLINGMIDNNQLFDMFNMKAIIPGKKAMNVSGVRALWASLKVLDILAIAIHKPLIIIENAMIITIELIIIGAFNRLEPL